MNIKEIKELLGLMQEHDLTEVEIEKDGSKIKLKKGSSVKPAVEQAALSQPVVIPVPANQEVSPQAGAPPPDIRREGES